MKPSFPTVAILRETTTVMPSEGEAVVFSISPLTTVYPLYLTLKSVSRLFCLVLQALKCFQTR